MGIMEKGLRIGNEKLIKTLLIKLNLIGGLNICINDIIQNGILMKCFHIDSFYFFSIKLIALICHIEYVNNNDIIFKIENRKEQI